VLPVLVRFKGRDGMVDGPSGTVMLDDRGSHFLDRAKEELAPSFPVEDENAVPVIRFRRENAVQEVEHALWRRRSAH
jgi:hypothetical protein